MFILREKNVAIYFSAEKLVPSCVYEFFVQISVWLAWISVGKMMKTFIEGEIYKSHPSCHQIKCLDFDRDKKSEDEA